MKPLAMGEAGFPLVLVHFVESSPSTSVIVALVVGLVNVCWLMLPAPTILMRFAIDDLDVH